MTTSRSALAATWLLSYLNDNPHFDSIMGDLEEFRSEGRSQTWYWRQTLVAVASHFVRDICSNKLLAFRGLVLAWALMPAYNLGRLIAVKASVAGWSFTPLLDFRRTSALHLFETSFQEIPGHWASQEMRARNIIGGMRDSVLDRLDLWNLHFLACGPIAFTTSQDHHRALRIDDADHCAAERRQPCPRCVDSRRSLGTVLHVLV